MNSVWAKSSNSQISSNWWNLWIRGRTLFARRYLGYYYCSIFLQVLRCFTSLGTLQYLEVLVMRVYRIEFPHSDISGSQVAKHLPEAYRSYATSFIVTWCLGIHHTPLWHSLNKFNDPVNLFYIIYFEKIYVNHLFSIFVLIYPCEIA